MSTGLIHHITVAFLVIAFPIWDRRETRYLKESDNPRRRVDSYAKTIGWQLALVAVLVATVPFADLWHPPAPLEIPDRARRIGVGLLIGAGIGMLILTLLPLWSKGARAQQVEALRAVDFFLPRGGVERRWFAALSITVGVCEEIIFRGFLIAYMLALPFGLGIVGASIAAALIFGIDHGYQGWRGILGTATLALVFTMIFFATGSLLVPMIVHALLDLRILMFGEQAVAEA